MDSERAMEVFFLSLGFDIKSISSVGDKLLSKRVCVSFDFLIPPMGV